MDLTFTVTGAMLGSVLLAIAGIGLKEKLAEWKARREAFEAHIKACAEKNTHIALLEQKVAALARQAEDDTCQRTWLGDCVVAIGSKMDVRLPERP